MITLGIDVSKSNLDCALVLGNGKILKRQVHNTNKGFQALYKWLTRHDEMTIQCGLESTGIYSNAVATFLFEQGFRVSVINPVMVKRYGQSKLLRGKTDQTDACLIADFVRTQEPRSWTPSAKEYLELRDLVNIWDSLVQRERNILNQVEALQRSTLALDILNEQLLYVNESLNKTKKALDSLIESSEELNNKIRLLLTIPGLGKRTASIILAHCPNLHLLPSARHAAAFAGVTPRVTESGSSVSKRPKMCKTGNARLRKALYFPAISAGRFNPRIKPLYERISNQGDRGAKMRAIGASMRKLIHIIYGVLKSGCPFEAEPFVT